MEDTLKADFQAVVDKHQLVKLDVSVTYPPQPSVEAGEFVPTQVQ